MTAKGRSTSAPAARCRLQTLFESASRCSAAPSKSTPTRSDADRAIAQSWWRIRASSSARRGGIRRGRSGRRSGSYLPKRIRTSAQAPLCGRGGLESDVLWRIADADKAVLALPFAEIARAPPRGDVAGQCLPELRPFRQSLEELSVDRTIPRIPEITAIGMGDTLDQSMLVLDPTRLVQPNTGRAMAEKREQRVILRKGVRELDDAADEERPQAAAAPRLRLEGIRVGQGAVVFDR